MRAKEAIRASGETKEKEKRESRGARKQCLRRVHTPRQNSFAGKMNLAKWGSGTYVPATYSDYGHVAEKVKTRPEPF